MHVSKNASGRLIYYNEHPIVSNLYIHIHICIIIITTKYYCDKITKQSDDEGLTMTKN